MTLKRDALSWIEGDMPFSQTFGDHFYAREDGRAEVDHVFVAGNRIPPRWETGGAFTIGETGFGTGLNFVETWRQWIARRQAGANLHFVSFEAYPMATADMARALGRWPDLAALADRLVGHLDDFGPADVCIDIDAQTRLSIKVGDALAGLRRWDGLADAWFLDGFAPSRNRDMWSAELMQAVCDKTAAGGTFATYTAAGWVRRNLEAAGFAVAKAPGYGGKREMMTGQKPSA